MIFTINGHLWQLLFVNPNNHQLYRENGTVTLGVTDSSTRTVYINNRLSDFMTQKVISHELVHVACFEYGYTVNRDCEELIADFLATYGRDIFEIADEVTARIFKKA